jgi:hypothetical protein
LPKEAVLPEFKRINGYGWQTGFDFSLSYLGQHVHLFQSYAKGIGQHAKTITCKEWLWLKNDNKSSDLLTKLSSILGLNRH